MYIYVYIYKESFSKFRNDKSLYCIIIYIYVYMLYIKLKNIDIKPRNYLVIKLDQPLTIFKGTDCVEMTWRLCENIVSAMFRRGVHAQCL